MDHFASEVLNRDVHARLVANIDHYAAQAGIQTAWISRRLADTCNAEEVTWVRSLRFLQEQGRAGLVLHGKDPRPDATTRMSAIAGALTRNFIVARVLTLNALLANLTESDVPDQTVLLVPNFALDQPKDSKAQAQWRTQAIHDALVARHTAGKLTVVYAVSLERVAADWGEATRQLVENHYDEIAI